MNQMQKQVLAFHRAFGVPEARYPVLTMNAERLNLRARLIQEEASEACIGLGYSGQAYNVVETADGLADLIYVALGAAVECGIDLEPVFEEVHRSNMSKMWTQAEADEYYALRAADPANTALYTFRLSPLLEGDALLAAVTNGDRLYVVKRADGKVIKSPSYEKADIAKVLFGGK